jgi:sec-independent protein translocase protein TatA
MGGGILSPGHLLLIALIVLLLFGNRLPSVMRSLGQGVVEFKKGLQGIEEDMKSSTNKIEEQPSRPQTTEEAKVAEAEPAKR